MAKQNTKRPWLMAPEECQVAGESATLGEDTKAFGDLISIDNETLNLRLLNNRLLLEHAKSRTDEHREPLMLIAEQAIQELLQERRTRQWLKAAMDAVQKSYTQNSSEGPSCVWGNTK